MSRFGDGECECQFGCQNSCRRFELWQANVCRAINGRRGQQFFRDSIQALESLPSKRLIAGAICAEGEVCAIGAYAAFKAVQQRTSTSMAEAIYKLETIYPGWRDENGYVHPGEFGDDSKNYGEDQETADLGAHYGMARVLAWQVAEYNDEWWDGSPEQRYEQALAWARSKLREQG